MLEHFFCDDWLENKMIYLFSFPAQNFNWKFGIKKKEMEFLSPPFSQFGLSAQTPRPPRARPFL